MLSRFSNAKLAGIKSKKDVRTQSAAASDEGSESSSPKRKSRRLSFKEAAKQPAVSKETQPVAARESSRQSVAGKDSVGREASRQSVAAKDYVGREASRQSMAVKDAPRQSVLGKDPRKSLVRKSRVQFDADPAGPAAPKPEEPARNVSKIRAAFSSTRQALAEEKATGGKTTFRGAAQALTGNLRKLNFGLNFFAAMKERPEDEDEDEERDVVVSKAVALEEAVKVEKKRVAFMEEVERLLQDDDEENEEGDEDIIDHLWSLVKPFGGEVNNQGEENRNERKRLTVDLTKGEVYGGVAKDQGFISLVGDLSETLARVEKAKAQLAVQMDELELLKMGCLGESSDKLRSGLKGFRMKSPPPPKRKSSSDFGSTSSEEEDEEDENKLEKPALVVHGIAKPTLKVAGVPETTHRKGSGGEAPNRRISGNQHRKNSGGNAGPVAVNLMPVMTVSTARRPSNLASAQHHLASVQKSTFGIGADSHNAPGVLAVDTRRPSTLVDDGHRRTSKGHSHRTGQMVNQEPRRPSKLGQDSRRPSTCKDSRRPSMLEAQQASRRPSINVMQDSGLYLDTRRHSNVGEYPGAASAAGSRRPSFRSHGHVAMPMSMQVSKHVAPALHSSSPMQLSVVNSRRNSRAATPEAEGEVDTKAVVTKAQIQLAMQKIQESMKALESGQNDLSNILTDMASKSSVEDDDQSTPTSRSSLVSQKFKKKAFLAARLAGRLNIGAAFQQKLETVVSELPKEMVQEAADSTHRKDSGNTTILPTFSSNWSHAIPRSRGSGTTAATPRESDTAAAPARTPSKENQDSARAAEIGAVAASSRMSSHESTGCRLSLFDANANAEMVKRLGAQPDTQTRRSVGAEAVKAAKASSPVSSLDPSVSAKERISLKVVPGKVPAKEVKRVNVVEAQTCECGQELADDDAFCRRCGAKRKLREPEVPESAAAPSLKKSNAFDRENSVESIGHKLSERISAHCSMQSVELPADAGIMSRQTSCPSRPSVSGCSDTSIIKGSFNSILAEEGRRRKSMADAEVARPGSVKFLDGIPDRRRLRCEGESPHSLLSDDDDDDEKAMVMRRSVSSASQRTVKVLELPGEWCGSQSRARDGIECNNTRRISRIFTAPKNRGGTENPTQLEQDIGGLPREFTRSQSCGPESQRLPPIARESTGGADIDVPQVGGSDADGDRSRLNSFSNSSPSSDSQEKAATSESRDQGFGSPTSTDAPSLPPAYVGDEESVESSTVDALYAGSTERLPELPSLSSTGERERARLLGRRIHVEEAFLEDAMLKAFSRRRMQRPRLDALLPSPSLELPQAPGTRAQSPRLSTPRRAFGRERLKSEATRSAIERMHMRLAKPRRVDVIADNGGLLQKHCKAGGVGLRSATGGVQKANIVRSAVAHDGRLGLKALPRNPLPWRGTLELNIWGWEFRDLYDAGDAPFMVPAVPVFIARSNSDYDAEGEFSSLKQAVRFQASQSSDKTSTWGSLASIDLDVELSSPDYCSSNR